MESTSKANKNQTNKVRVPEAETASASFQATFEDIEASFSAGIKELMATKNLAQAEAKLSLGAILLSLAICLSLVVVTTIIWALLNAAFGFFVLSLTESVTLAIITLLAFNVVLGIWLFYQLKGVWKLVGLSFFSSAPDTSS